VANELGHSLTLTDNKEEFRNASSPRINYSPEHIEEANFWIKPHPLLFEKTITQQHIECFEKNGHTLFFKTEGDLPFDIFAAAFYLLSRYEEWLPHQKDIYGRYAYENSLAFKEGFLNIPLINDWLQHFKDSLRGKTPSFTIHDSRFTFLPTYDIDEAFSFRHKEWKRNTGATVKDLIKGNWKRLKFRRDVLNNKTKDPFDSYEWMNALHQRFQLRPRYFFLLAERTGQYDRNILPGQQALRAIIKDHAGKYVVGIHPSWQSGDDAGLFSKEIETLSTITGKAVVSSRQHFIRFTIPQTYRQLILVGIKEDYSMGYGSINGFRASVASPFYWYDLEKEEQTSLLLYPFCYMEANSFFEQKFSPQQALEEMRHYHKVVKAVNGTMITIWHNTFLGTDPLFEGWREVYEQFVKGIMDQEV
jgi:hypothetical protein